MQASDMKQELARLGNGAHALAIQIMGNRDDAADAVHDAFAVALSRPAAYDHSRGPLKPWFLRVVRNRCIDLLRQKRPSDPAVEQLADPESSPERAAVERQRDRQLRAALEKLPPERRQIVVLRDYLDLSYAEIAAVLDIAPGTVMSRLHRSRMMLKDLLEQIDE